MHNIDMYHFKVKWCGRVGRRCIINKKSNNTLMHFIDIFHGIRMSDTGVLVGTRSGVSTDAWIHSAIRTGAWKRGYIRTGVLTTMRTVSISDTYTSTFRWKNLKSHWPTAVAQTVPFTVRKCKFDSFTMLPYCLCESSRSVHFLIVWRKVVPVCAGQIMPVSYDSSCFRPSARWTRNMVKCHSIHLKSWFLFVWLENVKCPETAAW